MTVLFIEAPEFMRLIHSINVISLITVVFAGNDSKRNDITGWRSVSIKGNSIEFEMQLKHDGIRYQSNRVGSCH